MLLTCFSELVRLSWQASSSITASPESISGLLLCAVEILAIELRQSYSNIASQAALQCRFMALDESGAFALDASPCCAATPLKLASKERTRTLGARLRLPFC